MKENSENISSLDMLKRAAEGHENLLDKLLDHIPGALYQYYKHPEGISHYIYISAGLNDVFEITPEELRNNDRALRRRIHLDDIDRVDQSLEVSYENLETWDCEFRVILPSKGQRWVRGVAKPERLDDGGVVYSGYFADVTEKKHSTSWVNFLNLALMNISESVIISDTKNIIIYANQKVRDLHGYEPEEILGKPIEMMPAEPLSEEKQMELIAALSSGNTFFHERKSLRKDGSEFDCEYSVTPIPGENSHAVGYIGIQRDVTRRKQILLKLQESNERFEQITKQSRAIAWETDNTGKFTYISQGVSDVMDYRPEELIHNYFFWDLISEADRNSIRNRFLSAALKMESFTYNNISINNKAGAVMYMSITVTPILAPDLSVSGYRGLSLDVTETVELEQQLKNEEERYRTTLLSVGEGVISTDGGGRITVMNRTAEDLTGWPLSEAAGKRLDDIFTVLDEHANTRIDDLAKAVLESSEEIRIDAPTRILSTSGKTTPVGIIATPIKNNAGDVSGVVIVFKDITEYRERQKQIENLSNRDSLTGLYNRKYYELAQRAIDIPENLPLAVIFADINGLKMTNDIFGHAAGDALIKKSAEILLGSCRKEDIVARVGGDEFIILIPKASSDLVNNILSRIKTGFKDAKVSAIKCSISLGNSTKTSQDQSLAFLVSSAENAMYKDKTMNRQSINRDMIDTIIGALHTKSPKEKRHSAEVCELCRKMGVSLGLPETEVKRLSQAGFLHDIGKIVVDEKLLNKENLSEEERVSLRQHTAIGYRILNLFDETLDLAAGVYSHHERWDGNGYPKGLNGSEIPLMSRIIAIAEAYDRILSGADSKRSRDLTSAIAAITDNAGKQFDPALVETFVRMVQASEQ